MKFKVTTITAIKQRKKKGGVEIVRYVFNVIYRSLLPITAFWLANSWTISPSWISTALYIIAAFFVLAQLEVKK